MGCNGVAVICVDELEVGAAVHEAGSDGVYTENCGTGFKGHVAVEVEANGLLLTLV